MLGEKVSIPFKRETAFKHFVVFLIIVTLVVFQFPSNGKLHSNWTHEDKR